MATTASQVAGALAEEIVKQLGPRSVVALPLVTANPRQAGEFLLRGSGRQVFRISVVEMEQWWVDEYVRRDTI